VKKNIAIVGAVAIAIIVGGLSTEKAHAQQQKLTIANGARINPTADYPGWCTLGAIGYDDQNNLVGISAGHCDEQSDGDGGPVYLETNRAFGPIGQTVRTNRAHAYDYEIILFDKNKVTPSKFGPALRIDSLCATNEPAAGWFGGEIACKDGQTSGLTCGLVLSKSGGMFRNMALSYTGDSGGPVVVDSAQLCGITVRAGVVVNGIPYATEYISIHQILNDIPVGTPGHGFQPVTF